MHPYLTHLLQDIEKAKNPAYKEYVPFSNEDEQKEGEAETDNTALETHFMEVERFVSEDPPATFGDYCGLRASDFPPAEQLSEQDMQLVIDAFQKMSYTWNLDFSFPDTLPTPLYYTFMVETLEEHTWIVNNGFVSFDYCSGDPEECKFGAYCNCLNYKYEG